MKATIEFDDALYRRLKIEAARRGRTVRELVAEGVQQVLDGPASASAASSPPKAAPLAWRPAWFGSLAQYGTEVTDHSLSAIRESVSRARSSERRK